MEINSDVNAAVPSEVDQQTNDEEKLPRRILPLGPEVVSRMAAGEVVARPSAALKELLENAIDAGSTRISVSIIRGGIVRLEVVDNGCGIRVQDARLLCERHTTSKLRSVEDLAKVATCGFRGEALASISHISELCIVSRTHHEEHGWRASYRQGKLVAPGVQAAARTPGTTILVTDMFRSMPARYESFLRTHAEEYRQMLSIVSRYALYHSGRIAMCCRKRETCALRATEAETDDLHTFVHASHLDNIRAIFGQKVASSLGTLGCRVLHRVQHAVAGTVQEAEILLERAYFSLLGASQTKPLHIYFVNGRLVECRTLRRAIEQLYARYYLKGPHHPFCYLELKVPPEILDVNVHPAKKEVRFLDEQIAFSNIVQALEQQLISSGAQRSFAVQAPRVRAGSGTAALLPRDSDAEAARATVSLESLREALIGSTRKRAAEAMAGPPNDAGTGKVVACANAQDVGSRQLDAADCWEQLCTEHKQRLFSQRSSTCTLPPSQRIRVDAQSTRLEQWQSVTGVIQGRVRVLTTPARSAGHNGDSTLSRWLQLEATTTRERITEALHRECVDGYSHAIAEVFREHVFVGAVDDRCCLIQFGTALVAVDLSRILEELYYQQLVGALEPQPAATPIVRLQSPWVVELDVSNRPSVDANGEFLSSWYSYALELAFYCGIHLCLEPLCPEIGHMSELGEGPTRLSCWSARPQALHLYLHSLPWVDCSVAVHPRASSLTLFGDRLVRYRHEADRQTRIRQVIRALALLYTESYLEAFTMEKHSTEDLAAIAGAAERVLILVRDHERFHAPAVWGRDGTLTVVARTERLYRIFERC